MKKLSFFLMAMLFSVMSFATEVTVTIGDYAAANDWVNSTAYDTLTMDEVVTVTANPTTGTYNNTGKYYDNGKNWRMYQNEAPAIVVTAAEGYQLTSVTFTYESNKTGVMVDEAGAQVASGTAVALDKVASATFSVSNTDTTVANGQARITAITVTYEAAVEEKPEVTTVELSYDLTNDAVLDRMGRRTVYTTDDVLGDVQIILPTFNAETTSYTDASLVVGDSTYAATATFAADSANYKEVYTAAATSADTIFNVTMTVTYPQTKEYTFFAMDDAEATSEDQGEEGEPFIVYTVEGAGMLDEEPVEFELMINQLGNIEGTIGEAFVMGTATSLYEEEGNLAVSGTAQDETGNTYNIELWVPLAGGEVEVVITDTVDVTLYNLTLEAQGNMAMVSAGGETGVSFWLNNLSTLENHYGFYFSDAFSNIWYGDAQLQPYGDGQYSPDGLTVAFISAPDAEGNATLYNFTLIAGDEPVPAEPELKGVVKRAVQLGESVVVLTHEENGAAHLYKVVDGVAVAELSQEGVIAVDPENAGDFLAISDIAATEDGKLVATNKIVCQASDDQVDEGYKRGELRAYIWDDLAGAPALWFTSKMSSNWYRSVQGHTIAYKGTSTNGTLFTTGVTATGVKFRYSVYNVIDGVYTDPAVNDSEHFHFTKGSAQTTDALGANYQLVASPLAATNWILDGELVEPFEIVDPLTFNTEVTANAPLAVDLGKKYNGVSVVTVGEQVLMVAPYADAEGKLAGVKVLDITAGLAADSVVATLDLDAPVVATAAATAVEVAAYDVNITLVADGYIYNLVYNLPKPERTEATVLNPFAYDLSSELSENLDTLTINYTLNANADAVEVLILSGEEVVKTIHCKGINKGTYTVEVPTAGLPQEGDLTWSVNVKGTSVAAPTQNPTVHSFYHPSGVDIDNNPENPTFGMLLVNEGMHSVKDVEGYVSTGFGAGIFAFNPALEPMPNGEEAGFNGGITFVNTNSTGTSYAPRRVRISDDGRIFVTSLDVNGTYLWELNPENLNEWTPVFTDTQMNELAEVYDADSNFVVGPNAGFDVRGTGENLQLLMLSGNTKAFAFAPNGFKCAEYNLGTAKTWTGAPTRIVWDSIYALVPTQVQVQYDAEGGIWLSQYRGTATEDQPGLVHWTAEGVEDYKELRHMTRNAGFRFNHDFTKVVIAGNNGAAKKATIYAVSKDANGAPVLTEETVIDMAIVGSNLNDFAFDYAGNLYACGNSSEKLVAWAMPYSGEVATPAASKYAFTLAPEPVYAEIAEEVTDLVIDTENMTLAGTGNNYGIEIYLTLGQDNLDGTFTLNPENSFVTINGWDANFIEGYAYDLDIAANTAKALTKVELNGEYMAITFDMSSKPVEALNIVITDATVAIDTVPMFGDVVEYALKMTANWTDTTDNTTYPVLVEVPVYYPEATEPSEILCTVTVGGNGDADPWLGFGEGELTISTVNGVVTAQGLVNNQWAGFAANVTISGKLPQGPATGLDNINLNAQPVKMIKDGMLIINKGGRKFNVQGAILK